MAPKVAIIFWSLYGHIQKLAEAEKEGIQQAGGDADMYQLPETLPDDVLTKMHAPPKPTSIPVLTDVSVLKQYDAFLFGIPTRYGNQPAQFRTFWDKTGQLWAKGELAGKYCGMFFSTASQGGGQESTAMSSMSTLAHHGIIYVPFGYSYEFETMAKLDEIRGGGPWGAGTFAGADGSRQPSERELMLARAQGKGFYQLVSKVNF